MHLVPVLNGHSTTIVVVDSSFITPVNGNLKRCYSGSLALNGAYFSCC
jgi:hypothetical protein